MTETFTFECGCEFPIVGRQGKKILMKFDPRIEKLNLNCEATWNLVSEGNTKGVFQLETRFGQQTAKKLRPRNIEHFAALTAIMRPGCINAMRDDEDGKPKSVCDHYIDRKNGLEQVTYFHPALKPILESTYGEMIYQEQAMQIAQQIAGFDLQEADVLRKAIGKKKADIMAKVKVSFLEGCRKMGIVTEEQAAEIFGWIEKSQRYSFNKSHAVSYAINGYLSAFAKAHWPRRFLTSYLYFAKEKQKPQDEIRLLINNAKVMDIDVWPPNFKYMNAHFQLIDQDIRFGFIDIKGIGDSVYKKLNAAIYAAETSLGIKKEDWTWIQFLVYFSQEVTSTAVVGMIESHALCDYRKNRQDMLYQYKLYSQLTAKEQAWVKQNCRDCKSLQAILEQMLASPVGRGKAISSKRRVEKIQGLLKQLKNPPYSLEDTPEWIASVEEARLGIPITTAAIDSCDTSAANCTCREFIKGFNQEHIFIAAQIDEVKETVTRRGKNPGQEMAFVSISDSTSSLDAVIFSREWKEIKSQHICIPENKVMVVGERSKDKDSLIVKKMWQLT